MKGRRKSGSTTRALVNKLDRVFSRFVRLRDADNDGHISCVTCGSKHHWKDCHAGHFVKRQHMAVRWDERNVNAQCCRCNLYMGGCQDEYAYHIANTMGQGTLAELLDKKRETKKWTRPELEELIQKYSERVLALESSGKLLS